MLHAHEGVRKTAADLQKHFPDGDYQYKKKYVAGEVTYLAWTGTPQNGVVNDWTDTFVIRDGKIEYQTIYYMVEETQISSGD